jgi:hypothetical protein
MKKFGYVMITFGFLAGALVAVLDEFRVQWVFFSGALVVGAAGIVLVRVGERKKSRAEGTLDSNIQSIESSLSRIVENITRLNAEKQSIDTYDVRHRIDELFSEDLMAFVDARESIAQVHGLDAYADVMSYFAAGERYLNRVWSASADGYVDEVNTYLDKAHTHFAEVLQKVRQLTPPLGGAGLAE